MENKNNWKRKEEREISIVDMGKKLLRSWKLILCCALVCAVVFAGYKYYKDLKAEKATNSNAAQPTAEETALTPAEKETVAYVRSLEKMRKEQDAYMEGSLLLKIDPYQENRTVLQYRIYSGSGEETLGLLEQYISYVGNGGAVAEMLAHNELGIPAQYLQELICAQAAAGSYDMFNDQLSRYFYVSIIGESTEMADQLADAMEDTLESYGESLLTAPGQEAALVSRQNSVIYDAELEQKRNNLISGRNNNVNTINSLVSQFSEAQMTEYVLDGSVQDKDQVLPDSGADQGSFFTFLDIKYIIAGLIAGIILSCCWVIFCYLLNNKIKSADELERNYDLCVYGRLKRNARNAAGDLRERNQILARLVLNCHRNNLNKIIFISEEGIESCPEKTPLFQKELDEQGIESAVAENMLEQTDLYEKLGNQDAVVIVAEAGKTAYPTFDRMLIFLNENQISLAGVIVVE